MGSYLTKVHEVNSISVSLEWYIKQSGKNSTPAVNLVNPTVKGLGNQSCASALGEEGSEEFPQILV